MIVLGEKQSKKKPTGRAAQDSAKTFKKQPSLSIFQILLLSLFEQVYNIIVG